jgi:hypothetical protein
LELHHFPETSIPWMNPAAEMHNLAVLFHIHKFQSYDPFPMNGRVMNRSRHHRCYTYAQPHFRNFFDLFPNQKLGCVDGCRLGSGGRSSSTPILCVLLIRFE